MNHIVTSAAALAGAVPALAALDAKGREPPVSVSTDNRADALVDFAQRFEGEEREGLLIEAKLTRLAHAFVENAKAIDPTVTGAWFGNDCTVRGRQTSFQSIYLERPHAPMIRRRKPQRVRGLTMAEVIEAHQIAWEQFGVSCYEADDTDPRYKGAEGERRWERCSDREQRAMMRLVSHKARSSGETRARAVYLRDGIKGRQFELTSDQLENLLESEASGGSFW